MGRARPFDRSPLSEDTIIVPSVKLPVKGLPPGFPSPEDRVIVVGRYVAVGLIIVHLE